MGPLPSLKPSLKPRPRLLLSLTTATEATALVDMVDTAAMDMEASTEDTTASVRLRLSPRLLLSPTLDTEDTEDTVAMEAMVDTATAGATMASVRLRLSPTSDMEVMEDTVLVAMEDTVVTVTAMASEMFPSICDHHPLNRLAFLHSYILTNK